MNSFRQEKLTLNGSNLGGESTLPSIAGMTNVQQNIQAKLDDTDEIYLGYGFLDGSFPYRQQDLYDREQHPITFDSIILENEFLRATFIPSLGGRLWSLFDKEKEKELTFANPVFRPGNLGIRNAWCAGGIEWNFGMVGHHPFTCDQVFTARLTAPDGTPVLRIYEFERIRACTYQVDFFLPEKSRVLFCRTRIVNPNAHVVPVYWWSNIAVPELKQGRVVVGAEDCFNSRGGLITKMPVPKGNADYDVTYPVNSPYAMDYFWRTKERGYVSQLNEDGYGIIQTATGKMKGRKLFVWGQGSGGDNWQQYLSGDGCDGRYVEIQAGLAQTQYECKPMPPNTAWEWLEAYGAMNAAPQAVHGSWQEAQAEVEQRLEEMISKEKLEELLAQTKDTIALVPAQELLFCGSKWGALENCRRAFCSEKPLSAHLDFGEVGEEQQPWLQLLREGRMPEPEVSGIPLSYMWQSEWTEMLRNAVHSADEYNWYTWYQMGLIHFVERDFERAHSAFDKSLHLQKNAWSFYGMAQLYACQGAFGKAAHFIRSAWEIGEQDASLAKECVAILLKANKNEQVIELITSCKKDIQKLGRIQLGLALAYLKTGNIEIAEEILYHDGGLSVPDIREGENSVTDLWFQLERAKAARDGKEFDAASAKVPLQFDFRMITTTY